EGSAAPPRDHRLDIRARGRSRARPRRSSRARPAARGDCRSRAHSVSEESNMIERFQRACLAACFAASAALSLPVQAQTTLEFPTWQAEEPGVSTWWKDLIAAYEKKYPDVKINLQQVPFAQFVKQMTVRFAAGNPPDIVHLPSRDFASFADQGW